MSPKALEEHRHYHTIESCTYQLHSWKPFLPTTPPPPPPLLSDPHTTTKPYSSSFHTKRPCLSDRATISSYHSVSIDFSKLSLFDDDRTMIPNITTGNNNKRSGGLRLIERKRRRRHGSRSVSGRSSDRSGNNMRGYSVGASAAYATCSDFPVAIGTDSSGELFGNGDANWSDVSEARNTRRENDGGGGGGGGERDVLSLACGFSDNQGNESGYGSETGYRADAEHGYDDEIDEEEDDTRVLFWGERIRDSDTNMEMVGENTYSDQKSHHRGRRKKHDWTLMDSKRLMNESEPYIMSLFTRKINVISQNRGDPHVNESSLKVKVCIR